MKDNISVGEAETMVRENTQTCPAEAVELESACGRVLREDVRTDRPYPPFNRATMDGVALDYASWIAGGRRFRVEGVQKAGDAPLTLQDTSGCIEIMTGAVLPAGCDCVVRVEDIRVEDGDAVLADEVRLQPGQNIHHQGSDRGAGEVVLESGERLRAPAIAVAASVGCATLRVSRVPTAAVVCTGDELAEVGEAVAPHRIRRSNDYALAAALRAAGIPDVCRHHAPDEPGLLRGVLEEVLASRDIVVLTGGVSMGKFDYVPSVLQSLGVKALFHKVRQRPGRPLWFGTTSDGRSVFALPGNPVSALVCLYRYVLPAVETAIGMRPRLIERAALAREVTFKPDLTYFVPVRLSTDESGLLRAELLPTNTSGDFAGLVGTDGFLELDAAISVFGAGYTAPLYRWGG